MNAAGEVGGSFVVSDVKISPTIWSPDGKATRLKSGKYGGQVRAINNNCTRGWLRLTFSWASMRWLTRVAPLPACKDGEPVDLEFLGIYLKASIGIVQDVNDDGIHGWVPPGSSAQPCKCRSGGRMAR